MTAGSENIDVGLVIQISFGFDGDFISDEIIE